MMEVCVDSVESALNAFHGGAARLELCSALSEGGLTPTPGLLKVIKSLVTIPIFVMLRPRGGDFVYSCHEIAIMKSDAITLKASGADGFVFGVLTPSHDVERYSCKEIVDIVAPLPTTFHRAIDVCRDINEALSAVIDLGFSRILTSGQELSVEQGIAVIKKMILRANGRIIIMPGAGITKTNVGEILRETGAKEFHASAKISKTCENSNCKCIMGMCKNSTCVTSKELVRAMVNTAAETLKNSKWEISV